MEPAAQPPTAPQEQLGPQELAETINPTILPERLCEVDGLMTHGCYGCWIFWLD